MDYKTSLETTPEVFDLILKICKLSPEHIKTLTELVEQMIKDTKEVANG